MNIPSHRGPGRPVRRRTRTFRPNYLSFAGTYQCNLSCPHCSVPIEWPDRLEIPVAVRFLEDAHRNGIGILGFTGGEPFLYPEFLLELTRQAARLGFRFDKIMTNGVWYQDPAHLEKVLTDLSRAGYSGKIGLSVDKFHGMQIAALAEFCKVVRRVFRRDGILSLSYASRHPDQGLEPVHALARELDAVVDWSELLGRYLLVSSNLTMTLNWNHLAPVERAERLAGAWDGHWFDEDYCEGPGQALIVTPRGEVKPCCGFASDLDELTIGNIHRDSVAAIIRRARKHPYVGKIFREGLTAIRDEIMARDPQALPGATTNHCYFCWYVLTRNLVALPPNPATGKVSLPMVGSPSPTESPTGETATALLMVFDGRTVIVGWQLPPIEPPAKQTWLLNITGPTPVNPPKDPMAWGEYQAWIDELRTKGYQSTAHRFVPCQR
jgi:hypothetical protein